MLNDGNRNRRGHRGARAAVNTWIADYAAAHPTTVFVADYAPALDSAPDVIDPTLTDDGVHPNAAGADAMAAVLTPVINANVVPV